MQNEKNIVDENEDILIKKCIEWDRNAQHTLYKLFSSKMFAVCLRYSTNREEAEDTLQEGFMKVFESIKTFRKEGSLEGWIRRIMVNAAIQKYRKRRPENNGVIPIENAPANYQSNDDTLSTIAVKELMKMIQKLPPGYKMVFNLYVFEGLKHREIAEQLGISEGTSKSNLSDARAILQRAVNKNSVPAKQAVGV